ncbi:Hint domain-containing protein [Methylobacterium sp. R2-1]|uniref:Hint domain-containing protein n=1 Tax=Methylobacterium sp. R2-1 TaxID=2587064 RepID=UPI00160C3FAC|nr:Hint domain-containing protein [Methylobacterium sp. R2-1]MBB2964478.1 hypothetical protein [Methylobacterium sp. R2-1]
MPVLTINIAPPLSNVSGGTKTTTGHIWFELEDGGDIQSYGFAPAQHGSLVGPGKVWETDREYYLEKSYSKSIYISGTDAAKLGYFAENPDFYGFDTTYRGVGFGEGGPANNCITFVFSALKQILPGIGNYAGEILPVSNDSTKLQSILKEIEIKNAVDNIPDGTPSNVASIASSGFFSCFASGTLISISDGSKKEIQSIKPGDEVLAFRHGEGEASQKLHAKKVVRIFHGITNVLLNLRGLTCTPGHVFLTSDIAGNESQSFATIASILRMDGTIITEDGENIRARTGAKLGTEDDAKVRVIFHDASRGGMRGKERHAIVRAGIPMPAMSLVSGTVSSLQQTLSEHLINHQIIVTQDGSLCSDDGKYYAACNWPEGSTPFDTHEARNWIIEVDGNSYTPSWIDNLVEESEQDLYVVDSLLVAS